MLGLTAVVLTTRILGFSDLVINRGLGAGEVGRMIFFEAVPVLARIFPFGVLVGCLVALGRLGADREILALESSGVAVARLVWPIVAFAGVMTLAALAVSLLLAPWASRAQGEALSQLSRERPWSQIRAGMVSHFGDWQLEAREVSASGMELRGVLLFTPDLGETVFAQSGIVSSAPDGEVALVLFDGSAVLEPRGDFKFFRFETLSTRLSRSQPAARAQRGGAAHRGDARRAVPARPRLRAEPRTTSSRGPRSSSTAASRFRSRRSCSAFSPSRSS